jgi:hypothetical protein
MSLKNAGKLAQALAAGDAHSCALLTTGSVVCWGANQYGQLGNGNTIEIGTSATHMGENLLEVELMPGALDKRIRTASTLFFGLILLNNSNFA